MNAYSPVSVDPVLSKINVEEGGLVKGVGRIFLTGIFLCALFSEGVQAQVCEKATKAFEQRFWHAAIEHLLDPEAECPDTGRMLAISYFQTMEFELAYPFLDAALDAAEEDLELNLAMLDVSLAMGDLDEAEEVAFCLKELGALDVAIFGRARIELEKKDGKRSWAMDQLHQLVKESEIDLALKAADELTRTYLIDQQLGAAYEVAQEITRRSPDPATAVRFAQFSPEYQVGSEFHIDLGYRFEYDDNVTFPDDAISSGLEDFRHVLMVDLLYQRPFAEGWSFYAQGYFLQSFHHDLNQFDQTRISGSAAIGQTGKKTGWRFPIEVTHDRVDGDTFRTSFAVLPGFYVQFGNDFFSHFYARIQSDDYDNVPSVEEDRSGEVTGAGVLLAGQVSPRIQLRSYLEFNRHDTDGLYWQRDETIVFLHGEFEFNAAWTVGLALRFQDEDYDNARVFEDRQQDESEEYYLNVTHKFRDNWRWRGQVSIINHESNIPVFDYDRNVYSIALTREF